MHPVLIQIGGFEIHTYGVLLAIAWLAGMTYLDIQMRRHEFPAHAASELVMWALLGSIVGARILFLVVEYPAWTGDVWGAIFSRSGFVFYGGLAGGLAAGMTYAARRGLSMRVTLDLIAPSLALGMGIGRLGCLAAGCCYGAECRLPWAITFHDPASLAPLGVSLHPAQLYLSAKGFILFGFLHAVLKRRHFDGQVFALYLMAFSLLRFLIEFLRDDPRGQYGPFSTSQWIGIVAFALGIWLYRRWRRDADGRNAEPAN